MLRLRLLFWRFAVWPNTNGHLPSCYWTPPYYIDEKQHPQGLWKLIYRSAYGHLYWRVSKNNLMED